MLMPDVATREAFEAAFYEECQSIYPEVDRLERRLKYQVGTRRLIDAARVLACPVKVNPPCWQHGRVIYVLLRELSERRNGSLMHCLDIGTAKGFSALCAQWALDDTSKVGHVTSVDVIDPDARERRNTVAEVDGFKTLTEILEPWPESQSIAFVRSTGINWLARSTVQLDFAFVDGKHTNDVVLMEGTMIARRMRPGSVVVFDDVHLHGVRRAVDQMSRIGMFEFEMITLRENRALAWGVKR